MHDTKKAVNTLDILLPIICNQQKAMARVCTAPSDQDPITDASSLMHFAVHFPSVAPLTHEPSQ